jgi:hypothetical protein
MLRVFAIPPAHEVKRQSKEETGGVFALTFEDARFCDSRIRGFVGILFNFLNPPALII